MSSPKIVVVFGATGVQGGSVVKSILGDPRIAKEYKIRGITRDPSKPNAQALVKQGVEAVEVFPHAHTSIPHRFTHVFLG